MERHVPIWLWVCVCVTVCACYTGDWPSATTGESLYGRWWRDISARQLRAKDRYFATRCNHGSQTETNWQQTDSEHMLYFHWHFTPVYKQNVGKTFFFKPSRWVVNIMDISSEWPCPQLFQVTLDELDQKCVCSFSSILTCAEFGCMNFAFFLTGKQTSTQNPQIFWQLIRSTPFINLNPSLKEIILQMIEMSW